MTQLAAIITTLSAWQPLGLAAIFFGLFIEGEIVIFTAMFLAHQGAFDIGDIILTIVAAVALNDLLWHKLGKSRHGRSERALSLAKKFTGPLDTLLRGHPFKIFLVSKFAYGFLRATLVRSGMLGMPTEQFIKYDYPAAAIWITVAGSLGYFASASLPLLKHYFKLAEIALVIILVSIFILWHVIIKIYLWGETHSNVNS